MRRSLLDPSPILNAEKLSQPHASLEFAPEPEHELRLSLTGISRMPEEKPELIQIAS